MRNLPSLTLGTSKTGLIKGTTSTYTTSATSAGMINGKHVTGVLAATNTALPSLDAVTGLAFVAMAVNKATVILVGQTAAGAVQMCQGSVVSTATGVTTVAGDFISAPQFPTPPDDFMTWGYVIVRTAPSASAWTVGTSAWAATGVTATEFVQCGTRPDRPQTS